MAGRPLALEALQTIEVAPAAVWARETSTARRALATFDRVDAVAVVPTGKATTVDANRALDGAVGGAATSVRVLRIGGAARARRGPTASEHQAEEGYHRPVPHASSSACIVSSSHR